MIVDEDWQAGSGYMAGEGIQKLFVPEESLIKLEAQESIYAT